MHRSDEHRLCWINERLRPIFYFVQCSIDLLTEFGCWSDGGRGNRTTTMRYKGYQAHIGLDRDAGRLCLRISEVATGTDCGVEVYAHSVSDLERQFQVAVDDYRAWKRFRSAEDEGIRQALQAAGAEPRTSVLR